MDDFYNALVSENSSIPQEYDWYAPLIGDWDFDYYDGRDGGRHICGEWIFRRILEGAGVEDLFICPSRATKDENPQPDGEYGVAVRMFDSERKCYNMVYTQGNFMARLEVHCENDKIVCTVLDWENEKWVFSEITENSFRWNNITVLEDGTWRNNCDIYAKRKQLRR